MDAEVLRARAAIAELLTARMDTAPPGSPAASQPDVDFELMVPALIRISTEWGLDADVRLLLTTAIEAAGWMAYSAAVIYCKAAGKPDDDAEDVARQIVQAYAQGLSTAPPDPG